MLWTFDPKKRTVTIDGETWTWREPTLGEYKAYEYRLERQSTVYLVLEKARQNFLKGLADYQNAADQIGFLEDESRKAAELLLNVVRQSEQMFDGPKAISPCFEGKLDEHLRFVREWMGLYKMTDEVRKNSRRASPANSRRARPKVAASAGSSSSVLTGNSSGRARKSRSGLRRKVAPLAHSPMPQSLRAVTNSP